jgi:hypothetical protein
MTHKRWTLTTFRDGRPVATAKHQSNDQALAAVRAAIAGEEIRPRTREAGPERLSPAELGAAAFLARAA